MIENPVVVLSPWPTTVFRKCFMVKKKTCSEANLLNMHLRLIQTHIKDTTPPGLYTTQQKSTQPYTNCLAAKYKTSSPRPHYICTIMPNWPLSVCLEAISISGRCATIISSILPPESHNDPKQTRFTTYTIQNHDPTQYHES